jgi:RNA polymerase sigma factor (sigma-70 family)
MMSDLPLPASAEGDAEWNELIDVIRSELTKIPDPQAQVFWLHCVEEVSLNDISMQLETSVNHIRVLLHRSRSRLRAVLQRDHPSLIENKGNE